MTCAPRLPTIKVAATNLLDREVRFSPEDTEELLGLIDTQADRLDRLVSQPPRHDSDPSRCA